MYTQTINKKKSKIKKCNWAHRKVALRSCLILKLQALLQLCTKRMDIFLITWIVPLENLFCTCCSIIRYLTVTPANSKNHKETVKQKQTMTSGGMLLQAKETTSVQNQLSTIVLFISKSISSYNGSDNLVDRRIKALTSCTNTKLTIPPGSSGER